MKLKEIISEEVANILHTSVNKGHYHFAKVNREDGSGITTSTMKASAHKHKIKNWKALEAKGHTHEVKRSTRR